LPPQRATRGAVHSERAWMRNAPRLLAQAKPTHVELWLPPQPTHVGPRASRCRWLCGSSRPSARSRRTREPTRHGPSLQQPAHARPSLETLLTAFPFSSMTAMLLARWTLIARELNRSAASVRNRHRRRAENLTAAHPEAAAAGPLRVTGDLTRTRAPVCDCARQQPSAPTPSLLPPRATLFSPMGHRQTGRRRCTAHRHPAPLVPPPHRTP
jgi:hypothetical protein